MLAFVPLLATCLLSACTHALVLETSTERIILGQTLDVELICRLEDKDVNPKTAKDNATMTIERLRITKMDASGSKITLAAVRSPANKMTSAGHTAMVTGNITDPLAAFIKVSWPVAIGSTVGAYGCDFSGFDKFDEFVSVRAAPRSIEEKVMTSSDVVNIVQAITNGFQKRQAELEKEIVILRTFITDELNKVRQDETRCSCLKETEPPKKEPPHSMEWPNGSYALLKPKTGCPGPDPRSPLSSTGNMSHFTTVPFREVLGLQETWAREISFNINDDKGNRKKMEMCLMKSPKASSSAMTMWPKGFYCIIQPQLSTCPEGFSHGYLDYKFVEGFRPQEHFVINYCCRSDGSTQDPIKLPTRDPFYQFRYGNTCQQVEGMNVTSFLATLAGSPGQRITEMDKGGTNPSHDYWGNADTCFYVPR